jgi:hypothetical protein
MTESKQVSYKWNGRSVTFNEYDFLEHMAEEVFEAFERALLRLDLVSEQVSYDDECEAVLRMYIKGVIILDQDLQDGQPHGQE